MVSILSFTKHALNTLAFALLAQGFAIPDGLEKRDGAGVITLDFDVVRDPLDVNLTQSVDGDLAKRDYIPLTLQDRKTYYSANISVGSNKQPQTVLVDTGSSDLWFSEVNEQCATTPGCKKSGAYDPKTSTTFQNLGTPFVINYGGGLSMIHGTWAKDTVNIGGASLSGQQIAVANNSASSTSIFGVGPKNGEISARYDNVPVTLKKQGYIKSSAYSLYLNSPDAATGQIIFGGVDTAKYSGSLIPESITEPDKLLIILDTVDYNGTSYDYNGHILVDSGTTLTTLSPKYAAQIAKQAGATKNPDSGLYMIDCNAPVSGTVDFTFKSGAKITVPLSEFVFHLSKNTCVWGIQELKVEFAILGDNVMRHAYFLFDLDAQTVSIAPVKYTTDSNIVAV